ncbi:MAG: aldo/keto reductase, partial [Phycisphaerae bacterium]|nr:aldo/keto reductase [Phycisphaerae bacterium]
MSVKPNGVSRRDFFRVVGAGATGYVLTASGVATEAATLPTTQPAPMIVPTRAFGKTGVKVSILSLGGMFDIPKNQLMLKQAIQYGVTYWDTADCYGKGKSEEGIGKYFQKNPDDRKKIFLVTKSDKRDLEGMTKLLNRSLERMKTDYVDLYFLHSVSNTKDFTGSKGKALMQWVTKAKAKGKIRFFGFSTHSNMEKCLLGAAKERFIDGIMLRYSYMSMNTDNMKRAVDACHVKGIGLTAMKTQA